MNKAKKEEQKKETSQARIGEKKKDVKKGGDGKSPTKRSAVMTDDSDIESEKIHHYYNE